jgi:hypothetical protein
MRDSIELACCSAVAANLVAIGFFLGGPLQDNQDLRRAKSSRRVPMYETGDWKIFAFASSAGFGLSLVCSLARRIARTLT